MVTIGNRIRRRRELLGISQDELARRIGYSSRSSINKIELDQRNLTQTKIKAIADALDTTPSYIMGWEDEPETTESITLHYAGPVAAHFNATPEDAYEYMQVPADWIGHRDADDFFLASVSGDSMYPHFQDGDLLLVLRCSDMGASGRIGIMVYGDGEATVKRIEYKQGEDWVDLVPVNPEYKTRRISGADLERCRVVGRVIKVIRTVEELV